MAFYLVKERADLERLGVLRGADVIGLDIETAGVNGLDPFQSRIRLLQLATAKDCVVLDLDQVDVRDQLEPLLCDNAITKVIHHAKFDMKHIYHHLGLEIQGVFCTFLASQLLAMGDRNQRHGLAEVCRRYLGESVDKTLQTSDFSGPLSDDQIMYAARDAELLPRLYDVMAQRLASYKLRRVSQLEFRTVMPVLAMELRGIRVDMERWLELESRYQGACRELEDALMRELPMEGSLPGISGVNLHAPEQVRASLSQLGVNVESTADAHLKHVRDQHPVVDKILRFRHLQKILNTTMTHVREKWVKETGRIHPTYMQIASASGRFACSDPNIQQVPRETEIRSCFIPAEGYSFIVADYSQVELRVCAGLSGDRIMLDAYQKHQDLHRLTAALTMGKPLEEVTKTERQAAKAINFGLIYAMGPGGLQRSAKTGYGVDMDLERARTLRVHFFHNYRGVKQWQEQLEKQVRASGYVRTAAGRIRQFGDEGIRVTELLNIPVQGTAAEGLKSALCIFWDRIKTSALDAHVVAIIHDEIVVEAKSDQAEQVQALLVDSMIDGMSWLIPDVPFEVESKIGQSWAEKP